MVSRAFVLLLCLAWGQSFAATIYVSNEATNGYIVGTDGGACTSTAAPCLTYAGAQTAAADGVDTIVCNGTFTMTNGITLSKALTTNPSVSGGCTLAMTNANANVVQFSKSQTFGAVTINGANSTSANLKPSASGLTLTMNGTRLTNCPTHCLDNSMGRVTTATWTDVTMASTGTGATSCFTNTNSGSSTFTITRGTYTAASLGNLAACMTWTPSATGVSVTVTGAAISVTANAGAANTKCSYTKGVSSLDFVSNTCTTTGATTTPEGLITVGHATVATSHARYQDNVISSGIAASTLTDGHGVQVGDETDLSSATISAPIIQGNATTGMNHAIYCGYATVGCRMIGNFPQESLIGVIQEGGSGAVAYGNIVLGGPLTGGGLRSRHGTNNLFVNNSILVDASTYSSAKIFETDDSDTGTAFKNNSFVNVAGRLPANSGMVSSGLSATFVTNNYQSPAYATGAFNDGTTAYDSATAWKAAIDTSAVLGDPSFVGGAAPTTAEGFCLKSDSALLGAGTYLDAYITGYRGESFAKPPAIGARGACQKRTASAARRASAARP